MLKCTNVYWDIIRLLKFNLVLNNNKLLTMMANSLHKIFRVGLTGGIACGKSTIANTFLSLGVEIVDADKIAHEVLEYDVVKEKLQQRFHNIILKDGKVNRKELRNIVFQNKEALNYLNSLVHPIIHQEIENRANSAKGDYVILDIPLLIEHKLFNFVDRILVADASLEVQIKRIMSRDNCSEAIAREIIKNQVGQDIRQKYADDLINTDNKEPSELIPLIKMLHEKYLTLGKN